MNELDAILPKKVCECQAAGHHVIEIKEGENVYYACEKCHYVLEAHCFHEELLVAHG